MAATSRGAATGIELADPRGMKSPALLWCLLAASIGLTRTARAEPASHEAVTIGSFAYTIDGYLSSTPAVLSGLDATWDHRLTDSWGLRVRAGAVLRGSDEIDGVAPHGEAGPFTRFVLVPGLALDASVLGGLHIGGLDHKDEWEDKTGPTVLAEVAVEVVLGNHLLATLGGGYRVAWTASQRVDSIGGSDADRLATGPVVRANLGWSF